MPEGDAVWRTARRLHAALAGRQIVAADLRWPDLSTADLRGRDTLEVVSRGKHLLHRIDGGLTLHSHLRMDGRWRVEATATLKPGWRRLPDLRALVATSDWTALGVRLGELDLVDGGPTGEAGGNSAFRLAGVWGRHAVGADLRARLSGIPGPVLLVDDVADSRWTLTCAAETLRQAGAPAVLPFVLALEA